MNISHAATGLAAAVVLTTIGASTSAHATGVCKTLTGHLVANQTTTNCTSPTGICFTGTVSGDRTLNGSSSWIELDQAPSAGMPANEPGTTLSYSGTLTLTTSGGTLTERNVGVIAAAIGGSGLNFTEIERTVSGTGSFATATGSFFLSGSLTNNATTFDGHFSGQLCGL